MSISFPETTRSLQADKNLRILLWLSMAMFIFALWFFWFFGASVAHYVSSQSVEMVLQPQRVWKIPEGERRPIAHRRYLLSAEFSMENIQKIAPGQTVKIFLHNKDTLPHRALLSHVALIKSELKKIKVLLDIPADSLDPLLDARVKQLNVAIFAQSPAAILFHKVDPDLSPAPAM